MSRFLASFFALLISTTSAMSQSNSNAEDILRQLVRRGVEQAQEQAVKQLFSMAPNGELTRDMAKTIDQRFEATRRVGVVSVILTNDLDGDGGVSNAEIDRVRAVLSGHERSQLETTLLKVDTDMDGNLSAAEIAAWGEIAVVELRARGGRARLQGKSFMVFDADGDGVVVVDDILKTIERVAKEVPPIASPKQRERAGLCELPKPSSEALPVYIGGYEGAAISTVAVAGLDRETSFATLEIEEGEEPIYLVVSVFDAMVLHVTGATERVERLVGRSHRGMGVVGLPEEVVDLISLSNCDLPAAHQLNSSEGIKAKSLLTAKLSREVQMIGRYDLGRISLPSGDSERPKKSRKATGGLVIQKGNRRFQMTEDGVEEIDQAHTLSAHHLRLYRFYPDGIASVMPEDVLTSGKAEAYDVLPQQAGLIQLLDSGALSILSDGTYSIDKPIARFPAGLNGGHSVEFVLRRGVPMPAGSPGHSSVLIEETGECLGSRC